jgi:hypothetical protein
MHATLKNAVEPKCLPPFQIHNTLLQTFHLLDYYSSQQKCLSTTPIKRHKKVFCILIHIFRIPEKPLNEPLPYTQACILCIPSVLILVHIAHLETSGGNGIMQHASTIAIDLCPFLRPPPPPPPPTSHNKQTQIELHKHTNNTKLLIESTIWKIKS